MHKPIKSNEEILHECIDKRGYIRLTISFSVGAKRLRNLDLVLKVKNPGVVHALADEVTKAIRSL